jgi:hypothetical protein
MPFYGRGNGEINWLRLEFMRVTAKMRGISEFSCPRVKRIFIIIFYDSPFGIKQGGTDELWRLCIQIINPPGKFIYIFLGIYFQTLVSHPYKTSYCTCDVYSGCLHVIVLTVSNLCVHAEGGVKQVSRYAHGSPDVSPGPVVRRPDDKQRNSLARQTCARR